MSHHFNPDDPENRSRYLIPGNHDNIFPCPGRSYLAPQLAIPGPLPATSPSPYASHFPPSPNSATSVASSFQDIPAQDFLGRPTGSPSMLNSFQDDLMGQTPVTAQFVSQASIVSYHEQEQEQFIRALSTLENLVGDFTDRVNPNQLAIMHQILKASYAQMDTKFRNKLRPEVGHQTTETSPSSPGAESYKCKICPSNALFRTRGSFRRHIIEFHQAPEVYYCPIPQCDWSSRRRDKVHTHLPKHNPTYRKDRDYINGLARRVDGPFTCDICYDVLDTWDRYFRCIMRHCRLVYPDQGGTFHGGSGDDDDDGDDGDDDANPGDDNSGLDSFGDQFMGGSYGGASSQYFLPGDGNFNMGGGYGQYQDAYRGYIATNRSEDSAVDNADTDLLISEMDSSESSRCPGSVHHTKTTSSSGTSALPDRTIDLQPHKGDIPDCSIKRVSTLSLALQTLDLKETPESAAPSRSAQHLRIKIPNHGKEVCSQPMSLVSEQHDVITSHLSQTITTRDISIKDTAGSVASTFVNNKPDELGSLEEASSKECSLLMPLPSNTSASDIDLCPGKQLVDYASEFEDDNTRSSSASAGGVLSLTGNDSGATVAMTVPQSIVPRNLNRKAMLADDIMQPYIPFYGPEPMIAASKAELMMPSVGFRQASSYIAQQMQGEGRSQLLRDVASSAARIASKQRPSRLRKKLQVVVEMLALHASVVNSSSPTAEKQAIVRSAPSNTDIVDMSRLDSPTVFRGMMEMITFLNASLTEAFRSPDHTTSKGDDDDEDDVRWIMAVMLHILMVIMRVPHRSLITADEMMSI